MKLRNAGTLVGMLTLPFLSCADTKTAKCEDTATGAYAACLEGTHPSVTEEACSSVHEQVVSACLSDRDVVLIVRSDQVEIVELDDEDSSE